MLAFVEGLSIAPRHRLSIPSLKKNELALENENMQGRGYALKAPSEGSLTQVDLVMLRIIDHLQKTSNIRMLTSFHDSNLAADTVFGAAESGFLVHMLWVVSPQ